MNINYSGLNLNQEVKNEMSHLLGSIDHNRDDLENIWQLINMVWDEHGCNNKKLNWSNIDKFYSHPVWLLNGFYIEHVKIQAKQVIVADQTKVICWRRIRNC